MKMQENQIIQNRYEEDEIDLKELFKTIWAKKVFIVAFTGIVTVLAIIYALGATKIFEAKAIVEIGSYKDGSGIKLLDDSDKLSQELNVLYIDLLKNEKDRESWVESISTLKKQKNFIELRSHAIDNDKAVKSVDEVVEFITQKHAKLIDEVLNEKKLELKNLDRQIESLKYYKLVSIDEDIKYAKEVELKSLEEKLSVSKKKLKDMENQLKITQLNISKTQNNNPSLTALNVIEKRSLEAEISDLKLKIIDMNDRITTINDKTLPRLFRSKEKLVTNELASLEEQKALLEQSMLPHNYKNSAVVGKVMTNDFPIKPKKKLIVVVAFVTGFILSIFLVFFMEFIRGFREEEK
jgi:uncharacterized protein involved in exopolysaccharide biosynthesis